MSQYLLSPKLNQLTEIAKSLSDEITDYTAMPETMLLTQPW